MWADAQPDGRPAEYGCALCESSVIPFLVPRRKVWLRRAAGVPCSNAANIYENERLGCKVKFARSKIPPGAKAPKNVYIVYQPRRRPKIVQGLVGLR